MEEACAVILQEMQSRKEEPLLIAIDGRCAAGKTTLADRLQKECGCNVIHMDHFFLRPEQRTVERQNEPGGNVDYERFLKEVMFPLRKRQPFSYRIFDCKKMDFGLDVLIKPNAVTVVEGSYRILHQRNRCTGFSAEMGREQQRYSVTGGFRWRNVIFWNTR